MARMPTRQSVCRRPSVICTSRYRRTTTSGETVSIPFSHKCFVSLTPPSDDDAFSVKHLTRKRLMHAMSTTDDSSPTADFASNPAFENELGDCDIPASPVTEPPVDCRCTMMDTVRSRTRMQGRSFPTTSNYRVLLGSPLCTRSSTSVQRTSRQRVCTL